MRKIALVLFFVLLAVLPSGAVAAEPPPRFGYPLHTGTYATAMATGPAGDLWFVAYDFNGRGGVLGKIDMDGAVTEYPAGFRGASYSIAAGPDGNLWFAQGEAGAIGRATPAGEVTSFPLPQKGSRPTAIAAGPDGNLWFTERATSRIGRISPSGEITEFALPAGREPVDITAGPEGAMWFTERAGGRIGRIATNGEVAHFRVAGRRAELRAIALGPDGNLWFSDEAAPRIGRITPAGRATWFGVPTAEGTANLVAGPGGLLWFTSGYEVAAIDTSGRISWPACLVQYCPVAPQALALGPDGALWIGAGSESCSLCGGGSAIALLTLRPGGLGRYELPPVTLGIGPRATPVRRDLTSLLLACGQAGGCRGEVRLGEPFWRDDVRAYRTLARGVYDLKQGEARRVTLRVSRAGLRLLRETEGRYAIHLEARAGPEGEVQAQRGYIALKLGGRAKRG